MLLFGLGKLVYTIVLLINAIAVLSEDRFLARIGWGRTQAEPGFGASYDGTSVKAKSINLIASVRTVMRSLGVVTTCANKLNRRQLSSPPNKANEIATVPLIVINTVIIVYELILG